MSASSESDSSNCPGCDSDGEFLVASSYGSEVQDCRKSKYQPQIQTSAWVLRCQIFWKTSWKRNVLCGFLQLDQHFGSTFFLQSEKTAVTVLVKLLPPSHAFLSCSWERCEGGLSGHELHVECVQSKTAYTNSGMPLLKIGDFLQNNIARHHAKKVCCQFYIFGFYTFYSNLWSES